jgi:hypothetical protein
MEIQELVSIAQEWRSYQYPIDFEKTPKEVAHFVLMRRVQTRLALVKAIDEFADSKMADSLYKNGRLPLTGE